LFLQQFTYNKKAIAIKKNIKKKKEKKRKEEKNCVYNLSNACAILTSVTVGSGFNPIGLARPTLTLGSGKFPSPTGWGGRRMRVECPTRPTRPRDVT